MKVAPRVAVVDRSFLAHNVYKMILKPLGFTVFSYMTLREFKENFNFKKSGCRVFLVNSNTFGNHFDRHWEWFRGEAALKNVDKIFLCEREEKKFQSELKKMDRGHLLLRPFAPEQLEETVKKFYTGKSSV